MANGTSYGNPGGIVRRGESAFSGDDTMNFENIDLSSESDRMERSINYYKSKLQSCRDKYENVENYDARSSRCEARAEERILQERLERINLSREESMGRSNGYENLEVKIRAIIDEVTSERNTLAQELMQMRKNADDNGRKLARVDAMITEQEEKIAALLRELREKSANALIPRDTRARIDALLGQLRQDEKDDAVADVTME